MKDKIYEKVIGYEDNQSRLIVYWILSMLFFIAGLLANIALPLSIAIAFGILYPTIFYYLWHKSEIKRVYFKEIRQ